MFIIFCVKNPIYFIYLFIFVGAASIASSPKKRKGRGPTIGKRVDRIRRENKGEKFKVELDVGLVQGLGANSEKFNNECGMVARIHAPYPYKEWRLVPETEKVPLRYRVAVNISFYGYVL